MVTNLKVKLAAATVHVRFKLNLKLLKVFEGFEDAI